MNNRKLLVLALLLLGISVLVGAFLLGRASKKDIKSVDQTKKIPASSLQSPLEENKDYWSIVGNVEAVTDKTITVKNNKGKVETATLHSDVDITKKGVGASSSQEVKVGIKVIVIGKNKGGSLTANRIIIQ